MDDYEAVKITDPGHIDDIKLVGTVMYVGENRFNLLWTQSANGADLLSSWSRDSKSSQELSNVGIIST